MVRYEGSGLGQLWSDEYGTAADPTELAWLLAYSPYHRVIEGTAYPPCCSPSSTATPGSTRCTPASSAPRCSAPRSSDRPILLRARPTSATGPVRSAARRALRRLALLRRRPYRVGARDVIVAAASDNLTSICSATDPRAWCGPASSGTRIGLILVLAVVIRFLGHRAISRLVSRTVNGLPVPLRRVSVRARSLFESEPSSSPARRQQTGRDDRLGAAVDPVVPGVHHRVRHGPADARASTSRRSSRGPGSPA